MLRDYKREVEKMNEPPKPALVIKTDPVEELLREWPELQAFGVEWVRAWAPHAKEELVETPPHGNTAGPALRRSQQRHRRRRID